MLSKLIIPIAILFCFACQEKQGTMDAKHENLIDQISKKETTLENQTAAKIIVTNYKYPWKKNYQVKDALINQIDLPKGYKRLKTTANTFGDWLRFLPLLPKEAKVHYFDGEEKWTQKLHHRVVDLDVGRIDLQQCADAIMRLKAEYHYGRKEFAKIHFNYTSGDRVSFDDWRKGRKPIVRGNQVDFSVAGGSPNNSYKNFKAYLRQIFSYAGTASLSKELKQLKMKEMEVGNLFIQGAHPGHAVLVMDMAENEAGKKIYLLAQSYMPAQEFHILKNLEDSNLSPWHRLHNEEVQHTAEWRFNHNDLKSFP